MKRKQQFERFASTDDGRIAIDVPVPGVEELTASLMIGTDGRRVFA